MANMRLIAREAIDTGLKVTFNWQDAPPGTATQVEVFCTDAELAGASNNVQLRSLLTTKLQRFLGQDSASLKLAAAIGTVITV